MKQLLFLLFLTNSLVSFGQDSLTYYNKQIVENYKIKNLIETDKLFQKKLNYLKNTENLEEYFYSFFDYFLTNPKTDKTKILAIADEFKWRKPKNAPEKLAFLYFKISKARYLLDIGNISKSVDAYENALHYYQKNQFKNYDIIEYCLKPLGNNYTRLGDYLHAEEVFKYTILLADKTNNKKQLIATYQNLSIKYQSINKHQEAITLLKKALLIKPISNTQKSTILSEIGKNKYHLGQYIDALAYLNKSSKINNGIDENQINEITKGLCYFKQKKFKKAENSLQKSLILAKNKYGQNNREVGKTYNLLAEISIENKDYEKGLTQYQNALKALVTNYHPQNNQDTPNSELLYAENTFTTTFDGMAHIYELQNLPIKATLSYNNAFKIAQLLQDSYTTQQAKIRQQADNKIRSEKILNLYYNLYKTSNNNKYINLAFESVEASKAMVLSSHLNSIYLRSAIKSDLLFKRERKFEKKMASFQKNIQLERSKNKSANVNLLKQYNSQKIVIANKLQVLKQELKQKYPFLRSTFTTSSISEIQEKLLYKNQLLIEFFDSKNALFVFGISKNGQATIRKITKDSLYLNNIQSYINLFIDADNNLTTYQKNAHYLYQQLLAPELEGSKSKILTIIPDGKLNFLTFDGLLTRKTDITNFSKMPLLIFQHSINYGYSATILKNQKKSKKALKKKKTLGFFPVFEKNHRKLQEIKNTLVEKKGIEKYTNGLYLEKEKATKKAFLEKANSFETLHLSTHASAGDFQQPAKIEFYNEALYLPEIYGLNLKSDLIILSACETGIGKLQKGEGAMSLARGFSYAGVENLLVSLWKVNDKSTSILMQKFYKNYQLNSKINALHQAKLDYLNDKNIRNIKKSPYYWSSFVFIGNAETIVQTPNYWKYGLFALFVLGLFFFMKRRSIPYTKNRNQ